MIETARMKLVPCELAHFEAIINDPQILADMLQVTIADGWLSFPEAISQGYEYLKANKDARGWWMYFFIHKADRKLIGTGGFKGKPDATGKVEIGYEIAPAYRNHGLATEAARGLIDHAFSYPQIKTIDAHTLAEFNHSTRVLEKSGMKQIETICDPEDGNVWRWRLNREDYEKN
jgi:[ribosomal protein S5]-alanine N-acetyltransferase